MEDEGYTSPLEDFDGPKDGSRPSSDTCDRNKIESWDELRLRNFRRTGPRHFITDNNFSSRNTIMECIWRIAPACDSGVSLVTIKSVPQEPVYISLSDFISDLFHLLNGRESKSFMLEKDLFRRNPLVLVQGLSPTALDNYSKSFIESGVRFNKLLSVAKDELIGANSLVFTTFQAALVDYLKIYQTVLMINVDSMKTLIKFQNFIKPYRLQLQALDTTADVAMNKPAVTLISELNRMIFSSETPCVQDLLRSLFVLTASTYTRLISDWIFRGELTCPADLHIKALVETAPQDRRFWTRKFAQVESENVPLFVQDSADLIFDTGKAINLFNIIKHIDYSESISSLFSYDTNQNLQHIRSFDDVGPLTTEWDSKLAQFLTQNKHLTHGIYESIAEVVAKSFKKIVIDFSHLESVRHSYSVVSGESRSQSLLRKRSAQQKLRISLQAQVDEVKSRKELEKQRDLIESRSNADYNARKEQEYDDEKKYFRDKYFPEIVPATELVPSAVAESITTFSNQNEIDVLPFLEMKSESLPSHLVEEEEEVHEESLFNSFDASVLHRVNSPGSHELKGISSRKRNYNKKIEKTIEEILAFKQNPIADSQQFETAPILLEDGEEKLDPEKFILTKSQPLSEFNPEEFFQKPKISIEATSTKPRLSDGSFINLLFARSIAIPLQAQHKMVNTALLYYFITEKQLFHHLSCINEFLLLQNGVFAQTLTTLMIEEMQQSPPKSLEEFYKKTPTFEGILNEALSIAHADQEMDPLLENLSIVLAHKEDVMMTELLALESSKSKYDIGSEFQFLNALRLTYVVKWPLNILQTEEIIHYFETLFGLFMQLARSEQLLNNIFLLLKSKRSKSYQLLKLQNYRHKLLHFVRTLRVYMNMEIVHGGWVDFCSSLQSLDSLQAIYDHIVRYVRNLGTNCFLIVGARGGGVLKLILRHLAILDSFCSQLMKTCGNPAFNWDTKSEIKSSEFLLLRRKHSATWQFHKMLLSTLYKASGKESYGKLESFLEFHDPNGFYKGLLAKDA